MRIIAYVMPVHDLWRSLALEARTWQSRCSRRYAIALISTAVALACRPNRRDETAPPSVRGVVTAVEAQSLTSADSITVRSDDGRTWRFHVAPEVDMTPGHLREHMTFGEPVTVFYTRTPDGLVAQRITD